MGEWEREEFSCATFNLKPASSEDGGRFQSSLLAISAKKIICSNFCAFLIFLVESSSEREMERNITWRKAIGNCVCDMGKRKEKKDEFHDGGKLIRREGGREMFSTFGSCSSDKFSDRHFSEKNEFSYYCAHTTKFKSCLFSPQSTSQRRKEKSPRLAARYLLSLMALAWFTSKNCRHFRFNGI